ncbi:glycosyl hydrolase 108 family protein [Cloacibacillus sp. An23]|uniref:glycoside hydrolase family 108 protein n=1 Tax=Cloacibacillus sp. An23 TaxID=1965591 RepID=UPI0013028B79|nr:glycosyl hydrolase 108 family protein [Cloacibacillus sp. An23]
MDEKYSSALSFVLSNEGGYVDDPHDRGGETNMGITASTMRRAYNDGLVKHTDVKTLTRDEAAVIYERYYWQPSHACDMDSPLCTLHFDAAVNHGLGGAAKLLQRTINNYAAKAGIGVRVDVDGAVGTKTLSALCQCLDLKGNVSLICEIYCNEREKYYRAIVESNPSQAKFLRGWLNRLARNRELIGER